MENEKIVGVWMDSSQAILTDMHFSFIVQDKMTRNETFISQENSLHVADRYVYKKDTDSSLDYYKEIIILLTNYDKVLLYGSQNAKIELFDLIKTNSSYKNIEIELRDADKMTGCELDAFYSY